MKFGAKGVLLIGLICSLEGKAQDYQAIQGSPFAGSLGIANNPASILSTPYSWDVTLFSMQLKNTTNAVNVTNFSYLSHKDSLDYYWTSGNKWRYGAYNYNVHLLNVRLAIGHKQAIAFGANLKSYGAARTSAFDYNDTIGNFNQFFSINDATSFYQGEAVSSSWLELFFTYSKTLIDNERGRLNGGFTLKAQRGISGGYLQFSGGGLSSSYVNSQLVYTLSKADLKYGYSSNYDSWKNDHSTGENLNQFLKESRGGASVDIGLEYLVKTQDVDVYGDPDGYFDYDWKIGVALLDFGLNQFQYGSQSRFASNPKAIVSDQEIDAKFDYVQSVAAFNDSLATLMGSMVRPRGAFRIWNPARFEINVDRPLPDHFAVNADLTLNLGGNNLGKQLFTKEISLFAVTPRWENRDLGLYLPAQVTTDGRVWVGGAFKLGPLLMGVHNWGNVFSKKKMTNGGFYLALVIHPENGFRIREKKEYTCPKD
ncbi:MAG TPA: hypothetical protein VHE54_16085 [Puia sp.]|nr:hypothetical protein [Puia sp.]